METWNKPANVNISEGRGFESILEILITIGAGINRFLICHATDSLRTAKFHFIEERSSLVFFGKDSLSISLNVVVWVKVFLAA